MELNDKIVIYRSEDGETQLEVRINQDTVWLNAYQIAELFGRDSKTIRKHIANAIKEELAGEVVVANFATTTSPASSSRIALLMCLRMVFESLPNYSAIWLAFYHTVSLSISTLNCVSPSAER